MTNTAVAASKVPAPDFTLYPTNMEPEFWAWFHTSDLPSAEPWTLVRVIGQHSVGGRVYLLCDFDGVPTYAPLADFRLPAWVCSECEERAVERSPHAYGGRYASQAFSHPEGEPLCPTIGERGYEPCQAV